MTADFEKAEKPANEHVPNIKIILFEISLQASFVRQEYIAYEKDIEKPVTWRDRILGAYVAPKIPHRKAIVARWVIWDGNILDKKGDALEQTLTGSENMMVIGCGKDLPWIGLNTHNTTRENHKLIRSTVTLPKLIFDELCSSLGSFPNSSIMMDIKVDLKNKNAASPLLPHNWFKVDGESEEADFVWMAVENVEIGPKFEHLNIVKSFMRDTSEVYPDTTNN